MKHRLEGAAESSGRSLSQEAELRLERSFDREDLVGDVLSTAYGEEMAGLLALVASAMTNAAFDAYLLGRRARDVRVDAQRQWLEDPYTYEQAIAAANVVFEALRPAGDPHDLRDRDVEIIDSQFPWPARNEKAPGINPSKVITELVEKLLAQTRHRGKRLIQQDAPASRLFNLGSEAGADVLLYLRTPGPFRHINAVSLEWLRKTATSLNLQDATSNAASHALERACVSTTVSQENVDEYLSIRRMARGEEDPRHE
jgi:hypothetical protein